MDFSNIEKLRVKPDETRPFTLYQIEGEPVLHLVPAGEVNKPYFNELLRRSKTSQRRITAGAFNASVIAENRANDRELYPLFVIRGWERVRDSSGQEAPATAENFRDFCAALPDHLFDEVRSFATDPQNFVTVVGSVEDVAGNSPKG